MDADRFAKQMSFIVEIDKLKKIVRQSALTDGSRQENDSEHSWHIAIMAILLSEYANEPQLDLLKVLKMLLIHDLVEIYAGDTFAYDKEALDHKEDREREAAQRIFRLLPDNQYEDYLSVWSEFEECSTPEAQFASALDALQPLILSFHNKGWSWKKHGVTKQQVLDKKRSIRSGSEALWNYASELIEKASLEGFLGDS
ncbi:MAG: HD domain-containing protein [Candidatus Thorarchaeota archaeon]|nr:HD domain-containing protein [Candidatus Thorarchaeota archaeon]